MRSKYAPRPRDRNESLLLELLDNLGCLGYSIALALVLALIPALALAWVSSSKLPFFGCWGGLTALLALAIFSWWMGGRIELSRRNAREWHEAGYPEIEVIVHWPPDDEEEEIDETTIPTIESSSDIDPESFVTLLRLVDSPDETFPTREEILTSPDYASVMKSQDEGKGFDQTRRIRFPAAKPPPEHLQPGARFELVSKVGGQVEGTGEILTVRGE